MSASAITIYQDFLDQMGEALVNRDAATFLRHIFLPHTIVTETHDVTFDTPEQAQIHFNGLTDALAAQRVDAYVRIARHARFDGPDRLIGQHETFMTSGGKLVAPAFLNDMQMERRDGIWGAMQIRHHARFVQWPSILPRSGGSRDGE